MTSHRFALAALGLLALGACSAPDSPAPEPTETVSAADPTEAALPAESSAPSARQSASAPVLALEGLGDLAIGKPVPAASSFKLRGVQASETCLIYSSPRFDGVYAIVEDGLVRRITVSRASAIKLVEGVRVGSTEKDVLAAFPGFTAAPHNYVAAPGKYLTQPGNDPRLRFEIGEDGKVTDIHAGMMPQLVYVEGCA